MNLRAGSIAEKGLTYCNQLFELERVFKELSPDQRHLKRLEKSFPIAEELLALAGTFAKQPKSVTKTAMDYYIGQWPYLKNIFIDGRLELSNNRAERSIKPFVIGRKNWLFSNSQKGAMASFVVYSIIETAKENGLNPFKYLVFLFERMPNHMARSLDDFMPWDSAVLKHCSLISLDV